MLMNTNAEILKTASTFSHSLTTAQLIDACEWVAAHPGTEEEALKDLASCRHDSAQEEALVIETAIALGRAMLPCSAEVTTGFCDGWCR